jgi:hypothetical protein
MDKNGFAIRVLAKLKRIFSKDAFIRKRVSSALKDSSREWITLLASVCADGTALPPAIIYPTTKGDVQAS